MRMKTLILLTWGLTLLGVPASTPAQDVAAERVPITDPALLEQLGFEADATDVFATEQVLRHLTMSPEERAAAQAAMLDSPDASPAGGPYGTSTWGYTPVLGTEFYPIHSNTDTAWGHADGGRRYCWNGIGVYRAQIHGLPHGADLRQVSVWLYDDHSEDVTAVLVRVCQPHGSAGGASSLALYSDSTSGTGGHKFLNLGCIPNPPSLCLPGTTLHEPIDLESCAYFVEANLGSSNPCVGFIDLGVEKARARWQRQISPPPSVATFDDVPTDHLFFQHIEALAASGITGGCGNGDFCPNAPLTRAQMAAFLATALGLHWGTF